MHTIPLRAVTNMVIRNELEDRQTQGAALRAVLTSMQRTRRASCRRMQPGGVPRGLRIRKPPWSGFLIRYVIGTALYSGRTEGSNSQAIESILHLN